CRRLPFRNEHAKVVGGGSRRDGLLYDWPARGCRLARTVSRRGVAIDWRGAKEVIAHGEFRTRARFKPCKRRERHHGSAAILYIELAHILRVGAVLALCLDVDLPLPAKTIEVVYE